MDQNTVAKLIQLHHHAISEEGRLRDEPKELLRRRLRISQNYGTSPKYNNFQMITDIMVHNTILMFQSKENTAMLAGP